MSRDKIVRAAIISGVIITAIVTWLRAGEIPIKYWSNSDALITPYDKKCETIVDRYLPQGHGRLSYDAYANMLNEVGKCTKKR